MKRKLMVWGISMKDVPGVWPGPKAPDGLVIDIRKSVLYPLVFCYKKEAAREAKNLQKENDKWWGKVVYTFTPVQLTAK